MWPTGAIDGCLSLFRLFKARSSAAADHSLITDSSWLKPKSPASPQQVPSKSPASPQQVQSPAMSSSSKYGKGSDSSSKDSYHKYRDSTLAASDNKFTKRYMAEKREREEKERQEKKEKAYLNMCFRGGRNWG